LVKKWCALKSSPPFNYSCCCLCRLTQTQSSFSLNDAPYLCDKLEAISMKGVAHTAQGPGSLVLSYSCPILTENSHQNTSVQLGTSGYVLYRAQWQNAVHKDKEP
jgi:hypothetical protein